MDYSNVINRLLNVFPELSDEYEENKDYLEGLPHLVFDNIFVQYIIKLYHDNQKETLIKACNFLNEMIKSQDEKIKELVVVSVLESLLPERKLLKLIQPYFNEFLQNAVNDLEKYYGWEN